MQQRFWLAWYDVSDEKRLRRVAAVMERYGLRVQKSVFECWLTDAKLRELRSEMEALLDPEADSLRFYTACETCRETGAADTNTIIQRVQTAYIV